MTLSDLTVVYAMILVLMPILYVIGTEVITPAVKTYRRKAAQKKRFARIRQIYFS